MKRIGLILLVLVGVSGFGQRVFQSSVYADRISVTREAKEINDTLVKVEVRITSLDTLSHLFVFEDSVFAAKIISDSSMAKPYYKGDNSIRFVFDNDSVINQGTFWFTYTIKKGLDPVELRGEIIYHRTRSVLPSLHSVMMISGVARKRRAALMNKLNGN